MHDWIFGYLRGATSRGAAATPSAWKSAEAALGAAPEELRAFYGHANGAELAGDVVFYPLVAKDAPNVVELSSVGIAGLKAKRFWRFGERGSETLLAARRGDVQLTPQMKRAEWPAEVAADAWIWLKWDAKRGINAYATLEKLLERLVPPTETEEFGEPTLARAMHAVQNALQSLEPKAKDAQAKKKPRR